MGGSSGSLELIGQNHGKGSNLCPEVILIGLGGCDMSTGLHGSVIIGQNPQPKYGRLDLFRLWSRARAKGSPKN